MKTLYATAEQARSAITAREAAAMRRYATRHHADHATPDSWCRRCERAALLIWAREQGLIRP